LGEAIFQLFPLLLNSVILEGWAIFFFRPTLLDFSLTEFIILRSLKIETSFSSNYVV